MTPSSAVTLRALRRFAARARLERCEMCSSVLLPEHQHVVESETGRIACACATCGTLFLDGNGRFRLIRRGAVELVGIDVDDATWTKLGIPVGLACIVRKGPGDFRALFPGPAGSAEQAIDAGAWEALVHERPALDAASLTEAVVLCRMHGLSRTYRVSIDLCYELVARLFATGSASSGRVARVLESVLALPVSSPRLATAEGVS